MVMVGYTSQVIKNYNNYSEISGKNTKYKMLAVNNGANCKDSNEESDGYFWRFESH